MSFTAESIRRLVRATSTWGEDVDANLCGRIGEWFNEFAADPATMLCGEQLSRARELRRELATNTNEDRVGGLYRKIRTVLRGALGAEYLEAGGYLWANGGTDDWTLDRIREKIDRALRSRFSHIKPAN